jgi:hypothetical protein
MRPRFLVAIKSMTIRMEVHRAYPSYSGWITSGKSGFLNWNTQFPKVSICPAVRFS